MAAGLLLLVCAGAVLYSAKAQDLYNELPDSYKKGVDLSLEQLSSHAGVRHHFRFLRSLEKSDIQSGFGVKYLYHHFYLKPTRCAKGTADSNPQRCPFRNNRALMDCAVCYKTANDLMIMDPKPYVHCIQKPRLTENDGNFVIYGWKPVWASNTNGSDMIRLCMQDDCNLVMYNQSDKPGWSTGTYGPNCNMCHLQLTDDGKLVLYRDGKEIWSSASSHGIKE
ncbi:hypothetical protein D5F01_LYC21867 [Larimichthys crocea]|uniref:Retinoic acid receptor responder protein 2 n=1 Tax=Larimichthys crocea TaxID=215358 RepID=A0A6G0HKG9_LARCR|nr:hypothetical protein D5F01_LYC21867 [Larimichthys crocea]